MEYRIFKMSFRTAVHFGNRNLEDQEFMLHSDTIFSALCTEAMKMGPDVLQNLYSLADSGTLLLSDAFPYVQDQYLLPKPMIYIEHKEKADSTVREKDYKKLTFIPHSLLNDYLAGDMDIHQAKSIVSHIGQGQMRETAQIVPDSDSLPYRVGTYCFHEDAGLYVLIGYESEETLELLEDLFMALSVIGVGGRRSTGLGKFDLFSKKVPQELEKRISEKANTYMSLSSSLPDDSELEEVLAGAQYRLIKRSGFVASESYHEVPLRKKDLFVLASGSCFSRAFSGRIADVSSHGCHPVYRYAKPFLISIDQEVSR